MTTIGVAVELPEPWRSELSEYRRAIGDHSGDDIPPHITLLGPVDIAPELLDGVLDHLAEVGAAHGRFSVRLDGTASFRPVSQVVFVKLEEGADRCAGLASKVRQGPLAVDTEFPYHPHVTVAHDLLEPVLDRAQRELADFSAEFEVASFRVYRHVPGDGWEPISDIPLATGA